ncbi:MAG: M1 family metallopeptidase [Planctomycetota bacterium]
MAAAYGQPLPNPKHTDPTDRFYPIESWLPTPNRYRTASGVPGPDYWQQRADYDIDVTLNDLNQSITGICRITYQNRSPETLPYVWIQLDQNRFRPDSAGMRSRSAATLSPKTSFGSLKSLLAQSQFDGGYRIDAVTDGAGQPLDHFVADTMMRVDCAAPLAPGESMTIVVDYHYNIVDAELIRARGGYEFFDSDKNYIYEIAQWYPRMAAYTDYAGWQHDAFLGSGEFTLELGDYQVRITAPDDMVVTATGTLQNPDDVLDARWKDRLATLADVTKPAFIITPEEAKANESSASSKTKTWVFQASNVRDFAFAASRKFIWDAMPVQVGDQTVLAMSFYPNEAEPLWSQYSTESIAHTLDVYGRFAFEYPYEVAISVNGPVYGMEYPMICFNGPRPEDDGTYSKATKYGLISVIIHEVGHNFFPMIVNSDERQWTWMDEGLNTFLQFLAEQEWEDDYPSRRGPAEKIVPYMRSSRQRPIMTGSDQILQFGNNAYGKPATALNILRDTVLGRERFDFAFRHFARTWKFKRPTPADFFRSIEDAAGQDLDWYWRGWFYSTDHVDIGIDQVQWYQVDDGNPDTQAQRKRSADSKKPRTPTEKQNGPLPKRIDWQPGLKDFYNSPDYDEDRVTKADREAYQKLLDRLDDDERELLNRTTNFYVMTFENVGGVVMPIPLKLFFDDNTSESMQLPAEIWRFEGNRVQKMIHSEKQLVRVEVDPRHEIADTDRSNNHWPPRMEPTRFELFKSKQSKNAMQKAKASEQKEAGGKDDEDSTVESDDS